MICSTSYAGGRGTCITYSAVDHALARALQYLRIRTPEQEWMPDELATVGEVFLEVSRILTKKYFKFMSISNSFIIKRNCLFRYGLTAWEVENKLPLLDTHKTNLLKYCPDYLAPLKCTPGRYRRFDGLCNNLQNPTWGARLTTFTRYLFTSRHILKS